MQEPPYTSVDVPETTTAVLIDVQDAWLVTDHPCRLNPDGYVCIRRGGRKVPLARAILGLVPGDGLEGDHINRDKLDNRRANLRVLTQAQNAQNVSANQGATSRYRGVYLDRKRGLWVAKVRWDGRHRFLGRHREEIDAARAADACRRVHLPFSTPEAFDGVGPCPCIECRVK